MSSLRTLDTCEAYYVFASLWHTGQGSRVYRIFGRLARLNFEPRDSLSLETLTDDGLEIYERCFEHYPQTRYIDADTITAIRYTDTVPRGRVRQDGYGNRIPTHWVVTVYGHMHRVYAIQWSNMPTFYIRRGGHNEYLHFNPATEYEARVAS